jgi:hypothetical protein
MIEFYGLPSHIALPRLEAAGQQIDFAFIDGAHQFDYALTDFFLVDRLLRTGGLIVFDDTWLPSIQRVCRFIIRNRNYSLAGWEPQTLVDFTWRRKLVDWVTTRSESLRRLLKAQYGTPDLALERVLLNPHCIAFKKESIDARPWDYHRDF